MKKKQKIPYVLIIVTAVVFVVVIYFITSLSNSYQPISNHYSTPTINNTNKTYASKNLRMSILVPGNWHIEEDITFVNLTSEEGKINISRIATNFDDINNYLKDFDSKRKVRVSSENNGRISDFNYVARVEDFDGGPITKQKVYFIYIDGWIYSLSTSSEALFAELDKIAQSFRYTP